MSNPFPLGRLPNPIDDRDKDYPFSMALGPIPAAMRNYKYWTSGKLRLNQGNEPACVGYTGANWLQASPIRTKVTNETGLELYRECKKIDGYDGAGTWDRALMKILKERGHVETYLWAQSPTELDRWLLEKGPVLIGVPWYSDMFYTNKKHFVSVGGGEVGGHEVLLSGINVSGEHYTLINSWGPGWGNKGSARISKKDLHRLLFNEWGTACTALEKAV